MPCAEHKAARCTQERDGRGEREWMEEGGERERASERGGWGLWWEGYEEKLRGGIFREPRQRERAMH